MPPFPTTTPHPGICPAPAARRHPRCVPASLEDRPARQNLARAPRAATPLLHKSAQMPIPAPLAPSRARVHPQLDVRARTSSSTAAIPAACQTPIRLEPSVTSLCLLQSSGQMTCHVSRRLRYIHQPPVRLAPRRGVSQFHFPHAIQNRLPEVSEHRERFLRHHRLVQHFPNDCKLHERAGPAFARDKSIRAPDELKEPLFPGLHAHFEVNPRIQLCILEKIRGHAVRFSSGFLRAARHRFHHPAVTAAANGETVLRQRSPEHARLIIIPVSFVRPRTSKYRDDELFVHLQSSALLWMLAFPATFWRRYVELLDHRHAQPGQGVRRFVTFSAL